MVSVACIERKAAHAALKESPVSAQLTEMVQTRANLLADPKVDKKLYVETMLAFRYKVYNLVAQALIREPEDLYRAADILQFSQDASDAECCLMAHYLARQAASKGSLEARKLAAASLDRYLLYKGLPQKYGTQTVNDSIGGLILAPIDPNTSDSERAEWDVLPLDQLKARLSGDTGNKPPNY
jgi:hypothetical protein